MIEVRRIALFLFAMVLMAAPSMANCSWTILPSSFDFGAYSVFGSGTPSAVSSIGISCSPPATATITLSRGTQSTSFSPRTARSSSGETMSYNLYLDAAGTQIWGDGSGGSQTLSFTSLPGDRELEGTIYGRLFPQQDAAVGIYNDFITVTVSWDRPRSDSMTTTLTVTSEVIPECQTSSAALSFGTYQSIGQHATSPLDTSTTLNVLCTRGAVATIGMSLGNYPTGSARQMRSPGGDFLGYGLFSNSAMSSIWTTTSTVSRTSTSMLMPLGGGISIYGRIPAGQDVAAGSYQDTVQAIVNY
ncbi:MAG TPA: spore coat U domain-containing protein [Thermoanaerobaculia bacterium]|nr:spore coat U domain-containing protein [Thermoanaerobaculia bacterium]